MLQVLSLENLKLMNQVLKYHKKIGNLYFKHLKNIPGIKLMEYDDENSHSYWFFQLLVENRKKFIKK